MGEEIVKFTNVWEKYRIKFIHQDRVVWEEFWALKDINFRVERGEIIGIIGENGAGKTTILKLIAGMIIPDKGQVNVNGRVSALMELGAGFHPDVTGRENILLNAGLYGLSKEEMEAKLDRIIEFAGIGKFINAPIKYYSQGMYMRLAFSLAIHVEPDILLIDDILAVGDEDARRKCFRKILELKQQNKTILIVSHDMNMLLLLCKRVIFLKNGRIIEDGLTEKIIVQYLETFGSKKGICSLEKDKLRLIFNNGRTILKWKDTPLTKGLGFHTSFYLGGCWYNSQEAEWEVIDSNENNQLILRGKYRWPLLEQEYKLSIDSDGNILWSVILGAKGRVELRELDINLIVSEKYTAWFSPKGKSNFGQIFSEDSQWFYLLDRNYRWQYLGLISDKFPSLVIEFDSLNSDDYTKVYNTDYPMNGRVLQLQHIFTDSLKIGERKEFSGKLKLDIKDIDEYLSSQGELLVIKNNFISISFLEGRLNIFYDNFELTTKEAITFSIFSDNKWYLSTDANWDIDFNKKNKLIVTGKWEKFPIIVKLIVKIKNNICLFKVEMLITKTVNITQARMKFKFSERFKQWFTSKLKGKFPNFYHGRPYDMLQCAITDGTIGVSRLDNITEDAICIRFFYHKFNNIGKIYNGSFNSPARNLELWKIISEDKYEHKPLRYTYFFGKIEFSLPFKFKLDTDEVKKNNKKGILLNKKDLTFKFDIENFYLANIFWNGIKLTKELGIYTCLCSFDRWYDSSYAKWKLYEAGEYKFRGLARWEYLPVAQYWEIELIDANTIFWKVDMEIFGKVRLHRQQVNIMLSEKYNNWFTGNSKLKEFPEEFKPDIDNDWERLCSGFLKEGIGVKSDKEGDSYLPSVKFIGSFSSDNYIVNVVNSDVIHRARLLQYLIEGEKELMQGKICNYFTGKILIDKE